jgi:hypothetical protein
VRKAGYKRQRTQQAASSQLLELGSLENLRASGKGGMDPDGEVAADELHVIVQVCSMACDDDGKDSWERA